MEFSEILAQEVKEYLEEAGHIYEFDEKNGFFTIKEKLEGTDDICLTIVEVVDDCILFRCLSSLNVPARKHSAVSEYINRANNVLLNGNFVLDYDNGSVVFKCYISCMEGNVSASQLTDSFASRDIAYSEFLPGITAVSKGQVKNVKAYFEGTEEQQDSEKAD